MRAGALTLILMLVLSGCGIQTSIPDAEADALADAAQATTDLERYRFEWEATYVLSEPDAAGRERLSVSGAGSVDAVAGDLVATFFYDPALIDSARLLFPGADIDTIRSETRLVAGEVYVRGFNSASIDPEAFLDYDTWYRITDRRSDFADPFNRSALRPADVVALLEQSMDSPKQSGDTYTTTVDRDTIVSLGERFPRSLFDFGLRIGGGDFDVSMTVSDGLVRSVVIDGDDPGAGVDVFRFDVSFSPGILSTLAPPSESEPIP